MCLTSEQLKVGEGLGEDPPALLFHGQRDHQQPVRQLGEVLDEVVLPGGAEQRDYRAEERNGGNGGARRPEACCWNRLGGFAVKPPESQL